MLSKVPAKRPRKIIVASGLAVLFILTLAGSGSAAYRVGRPITQGGGVIDQT